MILSNGAMLFQRIPIRMLLAYDHFMNNDGKPTSSRTNPIHDDLKASLSVWINDYNYAC